MKKLILTLIFSLNMIVSNVYASSYYLHPNGNNGNSGTSPGSGSSWLSLSYACGQLSAGDTLYIQGGTYTSTSDFCDPADGIDNVTITNYQSETPIFRTVGSTVPGSPGNKIVVLLSNNSSWTFENLEFRPTTSILGHTAFKLQSGSDYNTFRNLTVVSSASSGTAYSFASAIFYVFTQYNEWDTVTLEGAGDDLNVPSKKGQDGNLIILYTSSADYNYIHDSTFSKGLHDCIRVDGSYNEVYNNTSTDSDGYLILFQPGSSWNIAHGNTASGADASLQSGKMEYYNNNSDDNIWRYNVAYNSGNHGAEMRFGSARIYFYNNVLYGNGRDGLQFDSGFGKASANRIYNNVIAHNMEGSTQSYDDEISDASSPGGVYDDVNDNDFENNWIYSYSGGSYNNNDNLVFFYGGTRKTVQTMESTYAGWQNNLYDSWANPNFADPDSATPDFTIQAGSSLIDQGRWLTQANGPNNDSSLEVDDAGFFWYSAISSTGDQIAINTSGGVLYRTITGISGNTLNLNAPVTCNDGDEVTLYKSFSDPNTVLFSDSAPDIGAFEYPTGRPAPPSNLRIVQ